MTDRLPGKYQEILHSKPWFHSGKVAQIKYSYSQSGLTPSAYPIRVRSSIPGQKPPPEAQSRFGNIDQRSVPNVFREFREYSFIRDKEVLVTIEHCDRCDEHQETTHHDPMKYAQRAQFLKNAIISRYPIAKVIVKPISTMLQKGYANQRMGAFDVQVCCKQEGRVRKELIHSKLLTRKWPEVDTVLLKLAEFMPKCSLTVNLFSQEADENALKGIKIKLNTKKMELEPQRSVAHIREFTPKTGARPMSAFTTKSTKRYIKRHPPARTEPVQVLERYTDREGACKFANIPIDNYEIEVVENKEFLGATKTFTPAEEGDQTVYVELRSRNICTMSLALRDSEKRIEVTDAEVRLVGPDGQYFFAPEIRKGIYEISVPKGEYSLEANAPEYSELRKKIVCFANDVKLTEHLVAKEKRSIFAFSSNVLSGEAVTSAVVQLSMNNSSVLMEGVTSRDGFFKFGVEERGLFNFHTKKQGFIDAYTDIVVPHTKDVDVHLPQVPFSNPPSTFMIVLVWPSKSDDIELEAFDSGSVLNYSNKKTTGMAFHDLLKSHGLCTIQITPEQPSPVRIVARIVSGVLSSDQNEAPLLKSGVSLLVFHRNKQIARILPGYGAGTYWDIGIVDSVHKSFLETNVISNHRPDEPVAFYEDFASLVKFVRSPEPLSSLFEFDKKGETRRTEFGSDKFLNSGHFRKIVHKKCSEDATDYIMRGMTTPFGVSLTSIKRRYEHSREILGTRKVQTVENYARILGMDPVADSAYLYIAEEGLVAPLPDEWEFFKENDGEIKFRNSKTGEVTTEHPNDVIYREKFRQAKEKDLEQEMSSSSEEVPRKSSSSESAISIAKVEQIEEYAEPYDEPAKEVQPEPYIEASADPDDEAYEESDEDPETAELQHMIDEVNNECSELRDTIINTVTAI